MTATALFTILLIVSIICIITAKTIIVDTQLGRIEGTVHEIEGRQTVYSFKAIQYGISPVGHLRFRPSKLNESKWNNIYNATAFGHICMQSGFLSENQTQSEDCLLLNIWTPSIPNQTDNSMQPLLPVMVWIHGGSFESGSGSASYCNGLNIVGRNKDFVYISINYRVGIFGFFASQQLYDEDTINWPSYGSQNGLYDQIIALKWINKYISDYGGNASQITIFGESAGGLSVCSLAVSSLATNLFSRGIIQSGSCNGPWTAYNLSFGLQQWPQILAAINYPNNVSYLRSIPAQELQQSMNRAPLFVPSVDGFVLIDQPIHIYNNLTVFNLDQLIVGSNTMDTIVAFPWHLGKRPTTNDEYLQFLNEFVPNKTQQNLLYNYYYPLSDFTFYPPDHNTYELVWFTIVSDVGLFCPTLQMAQNINQQIGNDVVYVYYFGGSGRNGSYYAGHGSELSYVFDTNTQTDNFVYEFPWNQTLSNAIMSAWTAFGKFMQPNIADIVWNVYEDKQSSSNVLILRDKIEMENDFKPNYRNNVCQFWYNEVGIDIMFDINNDGANITLF